MEGRGERHSGKASKGSRAATPETTPKLSDLGISKTQSSRWLQLADVPSGYDPSAASEGGL
jgi:hypothetical protein